MGRYNAGRERRLFEDLLDEVRVKAREYADGITRADWEWYTSEEQSDEFFSECDDIIEESRRSLSLSDVWLDEAETVFIGEVNEAFGIPYRGYDFRDGSYDLDWDEDEDGN